MKNRKLFAILTLVAFMMTLLPVAAFAAGAAKADRFASILRVDKTSVEADGKKEVEFTVYVRDKNNNPVQVPVYVASERDSDVIVSDDDDKYPMEPIDAGTYEFYAFTPDKNGKVVFNVSSTVAGDTEIAVGLKGETGKDDAANPYNYLTNSDVTAAKAEIIGTKTVTFKATKTSDIQLVSVEGRKSDDSPTPTEASDSEKGDRVYKTIKIADVKANGTDYYELTFQVKNDSNAPVEGEKVEFSANKSNVRFNIEEDETDAVGEVEVKVYADKAGTYEIEAAVGTNTAKVYLEFAPADVSGLVLASAPSKLVAIDEPKPASFKLEFLDANGNRIDPLTIEDLDDELEFEWTVEPDDSDLEDDYWETAIKNLSKKDVWSEDKAKVTNDNLLQLRLPQLDEEGQYELKINIENGKSVTVSFEGREQGKITQLTLSYDTKSLQLNGRSSGATVKRLDKDGVSVELTDSQKKNDIEWSISDYRVLKDGYKDLTSTAGVLYITDDDDYAGTYTVIAVDKKNDLTATTEITVGKEVIGLDVEVPAGKLPVGKETTVIVKTVDADGHVIALGKDASDVEFSYYITSQPAGAKASAEEFASEGKFMTDLQEKGEAAVEVYSNGAGTVEMVFVVSYKQSGTKEELTPVYDESGKVVKYEWQVVKDADKTYKFTKAVTLNFAEETAPVVYGAKNVTMFIGSTGYVADGVAGTMDQAPFIQDNRTFVPLRAVATALGATNEDTMWDPATQTITLVRPDLTATMTIGNNVITLSNGQTVVADVAPFIVAETGRTVIPFRAIAEAFGADVEAVFAADGTTTAVTFTQN
ncbi:MAG: hypothetical protein GXW85_12770 [Clostridia bacterium]|nr:hypothetical protein [Clostridia bacterium]